MSVVTANPTTFDTTGSSTRVPGVAARFVAAVRAAMHRRATCLAYQDLLDRDDSVFRDIGVTRSEIRRALADCN